MRQPPRKKPTSYDEIGRVLRIYEMLAEEMAKRTLGNTADGILEVAERIAARTDDGDRA